MGDHFGFLGALKHLFNGFKARKNVNGWFLRVILLPVIMVPRVTQKEINKDPRMSPENIIRRKEILQKHRENVKEVEKLNKKERKKKRRLTGEENEEE
jgi:hypothetical protein